MHGLLNSFRKTREDVKVKRRVPLQRDDSDADLDDSNLEASGQWATRKGTPGTPDKAEDIGRTKLLLNLLFFLKEIR